MAKGANKVDQVLDIIKEMTILELRDLNTKRVRPAVMECYACDREATQRCSRCGNAYCSEHGGDPDAPGGQALCAECLDPVSATPSGTVFRASLFALLGTSVLALWLLVRPPALPGESSKALAPPPTSSPTAPAETTAHTAALGAKAGANPAEAAPPPTAPTPPPS